MLRDKFIFYYYYRISRKCRDNERHELRNYTINSRWV